MAIAAGGRSFRRWRDQPGKRPSSGKAPAAARN